jgi:D-alanyl-lipoteichoic acid acyltransferase DltB (MBOAT superfamily)
MLFNSYEFIFAFLPLTLAGFYVLRATSRTWSLHWLILASLFFYAWWRPLNVLIIAPSILVNFVLARFLLLWVGDEKRQQASRVVLVLGITFNVAFLGFFKYTYFIGSAINDVFGANLILTHIVLPLGISFITFQKIAFLIDVHGGRVKSFSIRDYCLFVLFFPQLIAGPIVHYREMMPQFLGATCRFDKESVSVGLTLFFLGLFKKVVLADGIAPYVTPIFEQAAAGRSISFFPSWMAAIGFTLQIYFDFSGYSDMALGAARLFGIRLPPNFNSPLRASSIIEFWLRWHMTLTRFLTAYIYNPLVLWLTRRRLAQGRPGFGGRNTTIGSFIHLLMFPTLLTMLLSGLWHGAGYQFIFWGLLHGFYLAVNHAWRLVGQKLWPDRHSYVRVMNPVGLVLTFLSVAISMVFFRAPTMGAAIDMLRGMIGLNGVTLPAPIYERLGPLSDWLTSIGVVPELGNGRNFMMLMIGMPILMLIALVCPNTLHILVRYEPALGVKSQPTDKGAVGRPIVEWNATVAWAIGISVIAAIGILSLGGQSEFLYWQF